MTLPRSEPRDPSLAARASRNVSRLRIERAMSRAELARAASLDGRTIRNLEAGRSCPTFATLREIARALDVDVATLVRDRPR